MNELIKVLLDEIDSEELDYEAALRQIASHRQEALNALFVDHKKSIQDSADKFCAELKASSEQQRTEIEKMLLELIPGYLEEEK